MPSRDLMLIAVLLWLPCRLAAAPLDEPIKPIPPQPEQDAARVELGRRLFYEPRLSANGSVSCTSCHDLTKSGADGRDRSVGFAGKPTRVNAPTVFNAALNFKQFWDGRADSLEAQVDMVVQNPVEMGSKWAEVVAKLAQDAHYRTAFANAYPDSGITADNIMNAIATFERTLLTPNSRFDRYLAGDSAAISGEEKAGYLKFKQYGCVACHQGVNVGGNMFQKFGVFATRDAPSEADLGRYLVTRDEEDKNVFKVPSLRNVALTAPYFHDATAKTLEEAVDVMFRYQLGRIASAEDRRLIVLFLNTLTGEPGENAR